MLNVAADIFFTVDPVGTLGGRPTDKNIGSIVLEIRLIKRVGEREPNPLSVPPSVVRGNRQPGDIAVKYEHDCVVICNHSCSPQIWRCPSSVDAEEDLQD